MVTRYWIGGGDDQASNADNWAPIGNPEPGDALVMSVANTMNIEGDALQGDLLTIGGTTEQAPSQDYVLNVTGHAHFDEAAHFPPFGIASITINLADHAKWIGSFASNLSGGVFITGDGRFANKNTTVAARSVVDVDVTGHGSFNVSGAQSVPGTLEFTRSVGRGQSVTVAGDIGRGVHSSLLIDDPANYHAFTTLGFGEITLGGLVADSYDIKGDLLELFSGRTVIDRLRFALDTSPTGGRDFGVSQTAAGVIVHADFLTHQDTLLPIHAVDAHARMIA